MQEKFDLDEGTVTFSVPSVPSPKATKTWQTGLRFSRAA
jgi:hypothetical protein